MKPTFFATPARWRAWLVRHHARERELLVGFYKRDSGEPSITWPESVDQALCFGWIDGVRRRMDEKAYSIRFTPRKTRSIWSAVNIKRMKELIALGLAQPAGIDAFAARSVEKTGLYSYENRDRRLPPRYESILRANEEAWRFFQSQPPWYQKAARWWVASAKKEETRQRRLAALVDHSAHARTIPPLTRRTGK